MTILFLYYLGVISATLITKKVYDLYVARTLDQTLLPVVSTVKQLDEVFVQEQKNLESYLHRIALVENVASVVGLIGVVISMLQSFSIVSASNLDQPTKAVQLATAASDAVTITAVALIVSISSMVAYSILNNRVNQLSHRMLDRALKVLNNGGLK